FLFLQGQSPRAYRRILKALDAAGAKKIVSKPYVFLCQPAFAVELCYYALLAATGRDSIYFAARR
ncbi:MAG TPA: hypothetical protein DHU74_09800, partial [Clostridiales bacterium]|nr:hypothetical protein [Clostridiales bacterium]